MTRERWYRLMYFVAWAAVFGVVLSVGGPFGNPGYYLVGLVSATATLWNLLILVRDK